MVLYKYLLNWRDTCWINVALLSEKPEKKLIPIPELQMELEMEFQSDFSNVLHVITTVKKPGIATNAVAYICKIPSVSLLDKDPMLLSFRIEVTHSFSWSIGLTVNSMSVSLYLQAVSLKDMHPKMTSNNPTRTKSTLQEIQKLTVSPTSLNVYDTVHAVLRFLMVLTKYVTINL